MSIFFDVKFTFTKGIPKLNRLVTRARDDLPVVSTKTDRQNIRGVSDEFPGCLAGVQIPEAKGVIPRSGKGELTIRRNDDVGDKVIVSMKDAFWVTERVLIPGQLPDDDSFVCRDMGQLMTLSFTSRADLRTS